MSLMIESCLGEFLDFKGNTISFEKSLKITSPITSSSLSGSYPSV